MSVIHRTLKATALGGFLIVGSTVAAAAVTFNGTFSLSGSSFSEPGLVIDTSTQNGTYNFDLTSGQSTTFNLLDIWTDENRVNGNNTSTQSSVADVKLWAFAAKAIAEGPAHGNTSPGLLRTGAGARSAPLHRRPPH